MCATSRMPSPRPPPPMRRGALLIGGDDSHRQRQGEPRPRPPRPWAWWAERRADVQATRTTTTGGSPRLDGHRHRAGGAETPAPFAAADARRDQPRSRLEAPSPFASSPHWRGSSSSAGPAYYRQPGTYAVLGRGASRGVPGREIEIEVTNQRVRRRHRRRLNRLGHRACSWRRTVAASPSPTAIPRGAAQRRWNSVSQLVRASSRSPTRTARQALFDAPRPARAACTWW